MADKFIVQVCNLPTEATEIDVKGFLGYCGTVLNVKLENAGKHARVAFVTFKEPYALETAVLLSGSSIRGQEVCIVPWGGSEDAVMRWKKRSMGISIEDQARIESEHKQKDRGSKTSTSMPGVWHEKQEDKPKESNLAVAGRAVTMAGDVVTTMLSKGYTLSKDASMKAKELDDKYQVTATSAAKVTALGKDAMTKAKEMGPVATTKMVALGKDAWNTAGSKVANNSYICAGAMWVSEALEKGSKAASDFVNKQKQYNY